MDEAGGAMQDAPSSSALAWTIYPGDAPTFVYDPRVHSRMYVEAMAERYSPEIAASILEQADALERRALLDGSPLATAEHGLDEVGGLDLLS
jgi:hypothetical protein